MKILYDHQIFSYQKFGGISRYFCELIAESLKNPSGFLPVPGFKYSVNTYLKDRGLDETLNFSHIKANKSLYKFFIYLSNKRHCQNLFKKGNYDILHPTFYDPYVLKNNKRPLVITVCDMTPELYPEYYSGSLYSKYISQKWINGKKILVEKADAVITISEKTRKDLIRIYNINDASHIKTIYLSHNLPGQAEKRLLDSPYLLFVGLRDKYKNFKNFIKGATSVLKRKNDFKILCIGGGKFNEEELKLLESLNIENQVVQMSANEKQLTAAYKYAEAFIFPSEYEGFGIPILEAFAMNCPVILSNSSCFPEIALDAGLYFNPDDPNDIETKIGELLNNKNLKKKLINRGKNRLKDFSWQKCYAETNQLYKDLLKNI